MARYGVVDESRATRRPPTAGSGDETGDAVPRDDQIVAIDVKLVGSTAVRTGTLKMNTGGGGRGSSCMWSDRPRT